MNNKEVLKYVDHTLLKAYAKWDEIKKLCDESIEYGTASVCVPPCYIGRIHEAYKGQVNICSVIGFPLGYQTTQAKLAECKQALREGANEIDMVINIADVKNGDYKKVEDEIRILKEEVSDKILKVIIETCYLNEEEKKKMCEAVTNAGADYIKTSTGFGTAGATLEDIKLFKENIGPDVKIKAAGGIRSLDEMKAFIKEGCSRIGTSSAIQLLKGMN
ncbi:MAG TPA: deoxyribose-phosphate aldolase [Clostridiales bacterium]|nr:deoxyribose-phosphate aldolase [Clostridiales bacterium]